MTTNSNETRIVPISPKMVGKLGVGKLVVPSKEEVEKFVTAIPLGQVLTVNELRQKIAQKYKVTTASPFAIGKHLQEIAIESHEADQIGVGKITPYWRVVLSDNQINPKYPGGASYQKAKLEVEGITVVHREGRYFISM